MHRSRTFRLAVLLFVVALGSSFLAAPVAWADDRSDDVVADNGEPTDPDRPYGVVARIVGGRDKSKGTSFRSLLSFLRSLGIISPWRIGS